MRDITSTFTEFGPRAKRKLPSEAAVADLFAGTKQAADEMMRKLSQPSGVDFGSLVQPKTGPESVEGQRAKWLKGFTGGLQGLSKMGDSGPPPPMSPIMMGDPIQIEQNISRLTGLPGYYQGGRIRKGERGVVGDEIVEVDEFGATVIPAEREVSRTADGELDIDARYSNGGASMRGDAPTPTVGSPNTRQLLSQPSGFEGQFGEPYGVQQTADGTLSGDVRNPANTDEELTVAESQLGEAMKIKPSKWKDFGYSLVQGLNNYFNKTNDTKTYSEIQRDRRVAQIAPQVEILRQKKKREQDAIDTTINRDFRKAQTANIYEDNKRQANVADQQIRDRKRSGWFRTNKHFDPSKATEAQVRQLAEFGETPDSIGLYDFTKPDRKTVAGATFTWNPNTKTFEDSGLPTDPSKAIVEYEVTDRATGVKSKYAVTSEKAASLKTQLEAAGMQIDAAKERQTSSQTHATDLETLRQEGRRKLAELKYDLDNKRDMSKEERKRKEKQVSELTTLLEGQGTAVVK